MVTMVIRLSCLPRNRSTLSWWHWERSEVIKGQVGVLEQYLSWHSCIYMGAMISADSIVSCNCWIYSRRCSTNALSIMGGSGWCLEDQWHAVYLLVAMAFPQLSGPIMQPAISLRPCQISSRFWQRALRSTWGWLVVPLLSFVLCVLLFMLYVLSNTVLEREAVHVIDCTNWFGACQHCLVDHHEWRFTITFSMVLQVPCLVSVDNPRKWHLSFKNQNLSSFWINDRLAPVCGHCETLWWWVEQVFFLHYDVRNSSYTTRTLALIVFWMSALPTQMPKSANPRTLWRCWSPMR